MVDGWRRKVDLSDAVREAIKAVRDLLLKSMQLKIMPCFAFLSTTLVIFILLIYLLRIY